MTSPGDRTGEDGIDLPAYLSRIAYAAEPRADAACLRDLHLAHATHVPFENLDILLGRPIRLDLASLQAKLVASERGGYCFEQNLLFAAALEAIGFDVTRLGARVRWGATRVSARTHAALLVRASGERWLADVGFGGSGPMMPIRLEDGETSRQFAWTYRVVEETPGTWVLRAGTRPPGEDAAEAWTDLYAFTLEPQEIVDYEVANWHTSTHPDSHFVRTPTAQRCSPEARWTLRGRELTEDRGGGAVSTRVVEGEAAILDCLGTVFGLSFPPGTRFG